MNEEMKKNIEEKIYKISLQVVAIDSPEIDKFLREKAVLVSHILDSYYKNIIRKINRQNITTIINDCFNKEIIEFINRIEISGVKYFIFNKDMKAYFDNYEFETKVMSRIINEL